MSHIAHLHVLGLSNIASSSHLEKALEAVPRVSAVELNPAQEEAVVTHDGADPQELLTAAKSQGYIVHFNEE